MAGFVDELTPAQLRALDALMRGETYGLAAMHAGVSRRTLYDWRQQPAFAAALRALKRGRFDEHEQRLSTLFGEALEALAELIERPEDAKAKKRKPVSPEIRVKAVRILVAARYKGLEFGLKFAEERADESAALVEELAAREQLGDLEELSDEELEAAYEQLRAAEQEALG